MASPDRIAKLQQYGTYNERFLAEMSDGQADVILSLPKADRIKQALDESYTEWQGTTGSTASASGSAPAGAPAAQSAGYNPITDASNWFKKNIMGQEPEPVNARPGVAQFLGQQYPGARSFLSSWSGKDLDPASAAPGAAASSAGGDFSGVEPDPGPGRRIPGRVYLIQTDYGISIQRYNGVRTGKDADGKTTTEDSWTNIQWVPASAYTPEDTGLSEYDRWQMQRTEQQDAYNVARDISDRDLRRQELIMQWDAQAPRPAVFTPQLQAPVTPPAPESTPRNFLNYWLWDEQRKRPKYDPTQFIPGQTPPIATDALDAAAKGLKNWITPEQWGQATGNVNMQRQRIYDPTAANVDSMTGTRPETDEEYHYRTVTVPQLDVAAGNIWGNATAGYQTDSAQDYMTGWAKANPAPDASLPADMANWRAKADEERRNYAGENWRPQALGPKAPEWAKGVLQSQTLAGRTTVNPWLQKPVSYGQGQINMRKLGTEGNAVKPVSAQMYQNWLPSQQQGYFGLAEAQQAERGQKVDLGDYMDNVQKMWTSSRTGQQGQRRARAY